MIYRRWRHQQQGIVRYDVYSLCITGKMKIVVMVLVCSEMCWRHPKRHFPPRQSTLFGVVVYLIWINSLSKTRDQYLMVKQRGIFSMPNSDYLFDSVNAECNSRSRKGSKHMEGLVSEVIFSIPPENFPIIWWYRMNFINSAIFVLKMNIIIAESGTVPLPHLRS